jgi:hypothetical protein
MAEFDANVPARVRHAHGTHARDPLGRRLRLCAVVAAAVCAVATASFDITPDTSHAETQRSDEPTRTHVVDVTMMGLLQANSEAEREALRRSRLHDVWYGWQVLTVDAAAVGILVLGAPIVTTQPPSLTAGPAPLPVDVMVASLGVYALGPIIHIAHGKIWQACGSIGLRMALPLAGFAVGSAIGGGSRSPSGAADGDFRIVVGSVGAMVTDAGALTWQRWYGAAPGSRTALFSANGSF